MDRSKSLLGIVIIIAGVVLLLNNLGISSINIFAYWPVLVIVAGLNSLVFGSKDKTSKVISSFVALLGTILLLNSLDLADVNLQMVFRFFWPVLIILVGLNIFLGRSFSGKTNTAFMGGMERGNKTTPWPLESGSYLAFMGGIELDLRYAQIAEGETILDLTAVMGGIEIKVPADLPIIADGTAVLGGVEFFGKASGGVFGSVSNEQVITEDSKKFVRIQARALMGGIEVKRLG